VPEADTTLTLIRGGRVFAPDEFGRKDLLLGYGRIVAIRENAATRFALLGTIDVIEAAGELVVPGFYVYTGSFRIPPPYLTASVRADITLIDKVLCVASRAHRLRFYTNVAPLLPVGSDVPGLPSRTRQEEVDL
jgi:hypothetical protein